MNKPQSSFSNCNSLEIFWFENQEFTKAFNEAPVSSILSFNMIEYNVISNGMVFLIRKASEKEWVYFSNFGTEIVHTRDAIEALHHYMDPNQIVSSDNFYDLIFQHLKNNGHYGAGTTLRLQDHEPELLDLLPIGDGKYCYTFWICDEDGEFGYNYPEDVSFGSISDILTHMTLIQFNKIKTMC